MKSDDERMEEEKIEEKLDDDFDDIADRYPDVLSSLHCGTFYSLPVERRIHILERLTAEAFDSHLIRYVYWCFFPL